MGSLKSLVPILAASAAVCAISPSASADTLASGAPQQNFALTDYVTGISNPTSFAFLPDGRMVLTEKGGAAKLRAANGMVTTMGTFPVDTTFNEKGLLNVLVDPGFSQNRRLLFYYSRASSAGGTDTDRHRVVAVTLGTDDRFDAAAEQILLRGLRGPLNHDGGAMAIGNDGKLYIGVGDTGCNSMTDPDPPYTPTNYFATCLSNANGKILRINLDGSIPTDNPLANTTAVSACADSCRTNPGTNTAAPRREIWAWGFRNPWRIWVDSRTGNFWVGDVGEIAYEEINVIPPNPTSRHFGWPWREGMHGHPVDRCTQTLVGSGNAGNCIEPSYYCKHDNQPANVDGDCESMTGGLIVDSCQWPDAFRGRYFFGDGATNRVWSVAVTANRDGITAGSRQDFATATGPVAHLGVGPDGALYWATHNNHIARVAPRTPLQCMTPDGGAGTGGVAGTAGAAGAAGTAGAGAGGTAGASGSGGAGATSGASGASGATGSGGAAGGVAGASGAAAGSGGSGASGGTTGATPGAEDDGCGCRVTGRGAGVGAALGLLALTLVLRRRRKHSTPEC
jgi:MYXO-CTERM domain-containing protein